VDEPSVLRQLREAFAPRANEASPGSKCDALWYGSVDGSCDSPGGAAAGYSEKRELATLQFCEREWIEIF